MHSAPTPSSAACAVLTPLTLHEVLALGDTNITASSSKSPNNTATATTVTLTVGRSAARFRCPVYLLAAGAPALRGVLEDLVEGEAIKDDLVRPATDTSSTTNPLPLPFLSADTFTTVAFYWEMAYGVEGRGAASWHGVSSGYGASGGASGWAAPSSLRAPVAYDDLYALLEWERLFVLQRLVRLPSLLAARNKANSSDGNGSVEPTAAMVERYIHNGAWVDALGVPVSCSSMGATAAHGGWTASPAPSAGQSAAAAEVPGSGSSFASLVFTLAERREVFQRLCATLEAATRLGTAPLQSLCAALAANMLAQLREADVGSLVSADARPLPAFTDARRKALLARYPWAATSAAVGTETETGATKAAASENATEVSEMVATDDVQIHPE